MNGSQVVSGDVTNFSDYHYQYEYDPTPPLEELLPVSLTYGATLIVGIVGNGLVFFSVCRYDHLMTITNTFLLSLSTADLLLILVCVPVKFAAFFSYTWQFGETLCKTVHYVQNVSAICSVSTLTMMSIERYYAIVHPMKAIYLCTVKRARRVIVLLWITSCILATPILIGQTHVRVGKVRTAFWCVKWFDDLVVRVLYEVYMLSVILIIPLALMAHNYYWICRELRNMSRHRSELSAATHGHNKDFTPNTTPRKTTHSEKSPVLRVKFLDDSDTIKQVIKMLITIVVIFVVCWCPILINNLLVGVAILPELSEPPYKYMREAFHLLSYLNSCVNPIVYGFLSRNFRKTFRQALCSCLQGRQYVRKMTFRNQSSVYQERWCSNTTTQRHSDVIMSDVYEMSSRGGANGEEVARV